MWITHNFFEPGKSDYNVNPIDSDDRIAMKHDLLYEKAKSFIEIHKADALAMRDFAFDSYKNMNWHSILRATDIGIKYAVEKKNY
jgi:hypothetical protein